MSEAARVLVELAGAARNSESDAVLRPRDAERARLLPARAFAGKQRDASQPEKKDFRHIAYYPDLDLRC